MIIKKYKIESEFIRNTDNILLQAQTIYITNLETGKIMEFNYMGAELKTDEDILETFNGICELKKILSVDIFEEYEDNMEEYEEYEDDEEYIADFENDLAYIGLDLNTLSEMIYNYRHYGE